MNDLERLCMRERQLLEGKWKTHSLPARKKATASNGTDGSTQTHTTYSYCRPTVSTEDVAKVPQQTQTVLLAYQYLDPHYRTYVLQPSTSNSGEYLLPFESPRFKTAQHHFIVKTPCDNTQKTTRNAETTTTSKSKSNQDGGSRYSVHLCPSCMQSNSNVETASLEAYDLASPCCDPHCVPTSRRRSRHKDHHRKDSKTNQDKEETHQRTRPHSQIAQTKHNYPSKNKYFNFSHGLVSQCSLHSCTSSELSGVVTANATGESSAASYTTSLSTDTLYWDNCDSQGRRSSKSQPKVEYQQYPSTSYDNNIQYAKPKSWDNLTTKAYGGYGFGYGYVESKHLVTARKDGRSHSTRSTPCGYVKSNEKQVQTQSVYLPHTHYRYIHPTKSSENLLSLPKFVSTEGTLSDSSLSCECLEAAAELSEVHFFPVNHHSASGSIDSSYGSGSRRSSKRHSAHDPGSVSTTSEITRL